MFLGGKMKGLNPFGILLLLQSAFFPWVLCRGLLEDYQQNDTALNGEFAYVTWTREEGYDIKIFPTDYAAVDPSDIDWIARGRYQNLVNKTGWGILEVETQPTWPDEMQMFAAGMAEGHLTRDLIFYFWQNNIEHHCDGKLALCKSVQKFITQNEDWVKQRILKMKDVSSYWHHVNLIYQQMEGLQFGFQKTQNDTVFRLSDLDLLRFNILGDMSDLESALGSNSQIVNASDTMKDGHCSALIKLIGNRDIYASHVSWSRYETMLKILKRYKFPLKISSAPDSPPAPGSSISMSSYPGMVSSMDDFYTISSGLLVTETSIINFNRTLWGKVSPKNSIYTGIRAMVANRLANDGKQWAKLFRIFNSGTYNNQWMILNYGLFEPQKPLNIGLLWLLEQIPGLTVSKDVTSVLNKTGYWASYNVPYFEDVLQLSGSSQMQQLMRYNDYKHDPLSRCNCTPPYSACHAISARCELNPEDGKYPFPPLGHSELGATDMKLVTLDSFLLQQIIAIAGPTYDPLPPFQWSKSTLNKLPHYGMPDKFEFEPIVPRWKWL
ncbi:unnamed protein product [Allacma fusca]|uniref:Phospholipase B-like n=1 Tax=Allacma fusca TaxID=39272 RepID=A0A8J2JBW7_9HEXA|nr:unnamed protein product [Allacma fusca]